MTQLATVSQETTDKCRDALNRLNQAVEGALSYNIHEGLYGGYDLVIYSPTCTTCPSAIQYHCTHIKEMLGYINGTLDHIIDTEITLSLMSTGNPQAVDLFRKIYTR